jgi:hypothetical protein
MSHSGWQNGLPLPSHVLSLPFEPVVGAIPAAMPAWFTREQRSKEKQQMSNSITSPFIEVMCRQTDVHIFRKLGFIAELGRIDKGVRMVNHNPEKLLLRTLTDLGSEGLPFTARFGGIEPNAGTLMAGDGEQFIIVASIHLVEEPVVQVREDGSLQGYEGAVNYWGVKENFEKLVDETEEKA